jgi:DNA-binding XRE family transcriptional regulator
LKIDGAKLKEARGRAGLSPAELATAAGYSSSQRIYQLENLGGTINDNIGRALAKALRCSVTEFYQND